MRLIACGTAALAGTPTLAAMIPSALHPFRDPRQVGFALNTALATTALRNMGFGNEDGRIAVSAVLSDRTLQVLNSSVSFTSNHGSERCVHFDIVRLGRGLFPDHHCHKDHPHPLHALSPMAQKRLMHVLRSLQVEFPRTTCLLPSQMHAGGLAAVDALGVQSALAETTLRRCLLRLGLTPATASQVLRSAHETKATLALPCDPSMIFAGAGLRFDSTSDDFRAVRLFLLITALPLVVLCLVGGAPELAAALGGLCLILMCLMWLMLPNI